MEQPLPLLNRPAATTGRPAWGELLAQFATARAWRDSLDPVRGDTAAGSFDPEAAQHIAAILAPATPCHPVNPVASAASKAGDAIELPKPVAHAPAVEV